MLRPKTNQKDWIKQVRNKQTTVSDLINVYQDRIELLNYRYQAVQGSSDKHVAEPIKQAETITEVKLEPAKAKTNTKQKEFINKQFQGFYGYQSMTEGKGGFSLILVAGNPPVVAIDLYNTRDCKGIGQGSKYHDNLNVNGMSYQVVSQCVEGIKQITLGGISHGKTALQISKRLMQNDTGKIDGVEINTSKLKEYVDMSVKVMNHTMKYDVYVSEMDKLNKR